MDAALAAPESGAAVVSVAASPAGAAVVSVGTSSAWASVVGGAAGVGLGGAVGVGLGGAAGVELGGVAATSASGAAAWGSTCGADSDPTGFEASPAWMFAKLTFPALADSAVAPVLAASEVVSCSSDSARPESEDASDEEVSQKNFFPEQVKRTPAGTQRSPPSESSSSSSSSPES